MKSIKTNTATIYMDADDILHIVPMEDVNMDYEDALDNYLVVRKLSNDKPVLKLIHSDMSWSLDRKARKFIAGREVRKKTIARAIVKSSVINIIVLNFFISLNKPKVPTRIFSDYEKARAWLLEIKKGFDLSGKD